MDKKNIAFLFGAGAEGEGNYGLPTGIEFLKSTFFLEKEEKCFYLEPLEDQFKKKYFDGEYQYSKNTFIENDIIFKFIRILIRLRAERDSNYFEENKNYIQKILSDEDLRIIKATHGNGEKIKHYSYDKKDKNNLIEKFKSLIKDEAELSEENIKLFDEYIEKGVKDKNKYKLKSDSFIGTAGILDSYFHTIINPIKFSKVRFSRIFNYYWLCYFKIITKILINEKNKYKSYLKDNGCINIRSIITNMPKLTKKLYENKVYSLDSSYYSLIRKEFSNRYNIIGVLTTNYYRYCENVFDGNDFKNKIAYLNGQLKLFEFPELLEVIDITKTNIYDDKIFFPFIFGQSYVKPIVNNYQIEAFRIMKKILSDSDILIILGYNINEDDNHINAYLHDFAKSKKIVFVTNKDNEENNLKIKLRLENTNNIEICKVEYGNNKIVIDEIKKLII